MSQLVAEKTYDRFTETTEIKVGNYLLHLKFHSSPGSEYLCVTSGYTCLSQDIILIDNSFRYRINQSLSQEDLLRFCNAKTIEASTHYILPNQSDRQRERYIQSLVPAAKLMYNTLYSPHFFADEQIQREWKETGEKAVLVNNLKEASPIIVSIIVIMIPLIIVLIIIWVGTHY